MSRKRTRAPVRLVRAPILVFALLAGLLAASLAVAQGQEQERYLNPAVLIENPQDVATIIDATGQELLLSSDTIRHDVIAEALRRAIVVRAVDVFIMVSPAGANAADSYVHSLSLAGARVRVGPETMPFLVADRQTAVTGPLLVQDDPISGEDGTFMVHDQRSVTILTQRFVDTFEQARVFEYVLPATTSP